MNTPYRDPRGPRVTIVEVQDIREHRAPRTCGGCRPLVLSCGHTAEYNQLAMYRIGDFVHCSQCADIAQ